MTSDATTLFLWQRTNTAVSDTVAVSSTMESTNIPDGAPNDNADLETKMILYETREKDFMRFAASLGYNVAPQSRATLGGLQCLLTLTTLLDQIVQTRLENRYLRHRIDCMEQIRMVKEMYTEQSPGFTEYNSNSTAVRRKINDRLQAGATKDEVDHLSTPADLLGEAAYRRVEQSEEKFKSTSSPYSKISETWGKVKTRLTATNYPPAAAAMRKHRSTELATSLQSMSQLEGAVSFSHHSSTFVQREIVTPEHCAVDFGGVWLGEEEEEDYGGVWIGPSDSPSSANLLTSAVATPSTPGLTDEKPLKHSTREQAGSYPLLYEQQTHPEPRSDASNGSQSSCLQDRQQPRSQGDAELLPPPVMFELLPDESSPSSDGLSLPQDVSPAYSEELSTHNRLAPEHGKSSLSPDRGRSSSMKARSISTKVVDFITTSNSSLEGKPPPTQSPVTKKKKSKSATDKQSQDGKLKDWKGKVVEEVAARKGSTGIDESYLENLNRVAISKEFAKKFEEWQLQKEKGKEVQVTAVSKESLKSFSKKLEEWEATKVKAASKDDIPVSSQKETKSKTQRFKSKRRVGLFKSRSKSVERDSHFPPAFDAKLKAWSLQHGYHPEYYNDLQSSSKSESNLPVESESRVISPDHLARVRVNSEPDIGDTQRLKKAGADAVLIPKQKYASKAGSDSSLPLCVTFSTGNISYSGDNLEKSKSADQLFPFSNPDLGAMTRVNASHGRQTDGISEALRKREISIYKDVALHNLTSPSLYEEPQDKEFLSSTDSGLAHALVADSERQSAPACLTVHLVKARLDVDHQQPVKLESTIGVEKSEKVSLKTVQNLSNPRDANLKTNQPQTHEPKIHASQADKKNQQLLASDGKPHQSWSAGNMAHAPSKVAHQPTVNKAYTPEPTEDKTYQSLLLGDKTQPTHTQMTVSGSLQTFLTPQNAEKTQVPEKGAAEQRIAQNHADLTGSMALCSWYSQEDSADDKMSGVDQNQMKEKPLDTSTSPISTEADCRCMHGSALKMQQQHANPDFKPGVICQERTTQGYHCLLQNHQDDKYYLRANSCLPEAPVINDQIIEMESSPQNENIQDQQTQEENKQFAPNYASHDTVSCSALEPSQAATRDALHGGLENVRERIVYGHVTKNSDLEHIKKDRVEKELHRNNALAFSVSTLDDNRNVVTRKIQHSTDHEGDQQGRSDLRGSLESCNSDSIYYTAPTTPLDDPVYLGPEVPLKEKLRSLAMAYQHEEQKALQSHIAERGIQDNQSGVPAFKKTHSRIRSDEGVASPGNQKASSLPYMNNSIRRDSISANTAKSASLNRGLSLGNSYEAIKLQSLPRTYSKVPKQPVNSLVSQFERGHLSSLNDSAPSMTITSLIKSSVTRLKSADELLVSEPRSAQPTSKRISLELFIHDDGTKTPDRDCKEASNEGIVHKAKATFNHSGQINAHLGTDFTKYSGAVK